MALISSWISLCLPVNKEVSSLILEIVYCGEISFDFSYILRPPIIETRLSAKLLLTGLTELAGLLNFDLPSAYFENWLNFPSGIIWKSV